MIAVKLKKYSVNELRGRLSSGKNVSIVLSEKKGKILYTIDITLFRADIIKTLSLSGENYKSETYILTVEKYETDYPGDKEGGGIIDQRLIFHKLEEAIKYLDKNKWIRKEDWIIE